MGQTESAEAAVNVETEAAVNVETEAAATTTNNDSNPSSLESVLAEAAAYGNQDQVTEQSIEAKAQKALECPCIADLRSGPCGFQFSEAFLCFLKSTAEEKGSDCVHPFVALQSCIKANPYAFSKEILGEDESKEVEPIQEYKIIPPTWSKESESPKSRL